MALISLFFQKKAKLGVLELDASLNETHEAAATLTQSEVEDGSTINDNVVLLPRKLTLEGFVSLTPLGLAGLLGSASTAIATAATSKVKNKAVKAAATVGLASLGGLVANAVASGLAGAKSRAPTDVWDYLDELRTRRLPIDVVTALKKYPNMVVTMVSTPRNKDNTGGLRFTITLEQVKIVSSQTVAISAVPGAAGAANLGKQAAGSASAATSSNASILYQGFSAVGAVP